jgi:predicted dehydrogenase
VRTRKSGRSHLLAAGCHAVDALRWCTGLEASSVSAYATTRTRGYQWPTSIIVNLEMAGTGVRAGKPVLAQLVSSTDMQLPYTFGVEMMGERASLRDDLILWSDTPVDLEELRQACPFDDVSFEAVTLPTGAAAIRVKTLMPGSADVSHHPFQGEIDELVQCILEDRESHLNVHDAEITMRLCLEADRSAEAQGKVIRLNRSAR